MDVAAAYRRCEEITWSQARNFSYGIRLLPAPKRHALAAVYAFARRIDDIGDGLLPAPQKLAALAEARASLAALQAGTVERTDAVLIALADAAAKFGIPLAAFGELIDGCEADVRGTRYQTFDELLHYCRCVAGSIGRLSLGVFGTGDPAKLAALVEFEAERARTWYARGLTLMPLLDRRSAASAGAMAGIYLRLLEHIAAAPAAVLTSRVSLSTSEKALVAAQSLTAAILRTRGRRKPPGAPPGAAR